MIYTNLQNKTQLNSAVIEHLPHNYAIRYKPEIYEIWDFEQNNLENIDIYTVTKGMNKKVWWYCELCQESYLQRIDVKCKNSKCSICTGKTVVQSNCVATTNPEVHKLMLNQKDGFKYTYKSDARIDWKCDICDFIIRDKQIKNISNKGLSCPQCSDGTSYPEIVMINILRELNIDFIYDKALPFSMNKRYDFFLPEYNCIIEMHGRQHFDNNGFESTGGRTLDEERANDVLKKELAIHNGVAYYFSINCEKSDILWIKNSILESDISDIVNFDRVRWNKVGEASNHRKIECLKMYNSNRRDYKNMAQELQIDYSTLLRWLRFWNSIGKCSYTPEQTSKKIVQLSANGEYIQTWNSVSEARKEYKNVSKVLSGERQFSNGYKFQYEEDYYSSTTER